MKKRYVILLFLFSFRYSDAQNTAWSTSSNIGIGTTNPQAALAVKGVSGWGTIKVLPTSDNAEAGISISNKASETDFSQSWLIATGAWGLGSNFAIGSTSTAPTITLMRSSGNVGIGTTNPLGKLAVNGKTVLGNGNMTINDARSLSDLK